MRQSCTRSRLTGYLTLLGVALLAYLMTTVAVCCNDTRVTRLSRLPHLRVETPVLRDIFSLTFCPLFSERDTARWYVARRGRTS
jgi:hypothetical protein